MLTRLANPIFFEPKPVWVPPHIMIPLYEHVRHPPPFSFFSLFFRAERCCCNVSKSWFLVNLFHYIRLTNALCVCSFKWTDPKGNPGVIYMKYNVWDHFLSRLQALLTEWNESADMRALILLNICSINHLEVCRNRFFLLGNNPSPPCRHP